MQKFSFGTALLEHPVQNIVFVLILGPPEPPYKQNENFIYEVLGIKIG